MLRRGAIVVASVVALLAAARAPAHADPPAPGERVRFSWVRAEGAETCPGAPAITREVARLLGRDPFAPDAARAIEALAARADGGPWTARIFVRQPDGALAGAREIRNDAAPDCEPLAASVALAVALAIDPEAALAAPPRPPTTATQSSSAALAAGAATSSPPRATSTSATTPPPPSSARAPRPPAARGEPQPPRTAVTARALLGVGLLPAVSPGVALAARGTLYDRLGWSADLLLLPEQRTPMPDQGFAFGLTAGRLAVCVDALRSPRVALEGCAGGGLGDLHAVVYSPIPTAPGDRVWVGLFAGARLTVWVAGPLVLEAGVDGVVPLTRQAFTVVTRPDPVFQQSAVAALGYLGAGLRF